MTIGPLKKLRTLCSAWREIFRMPGAKRMLAHLVNPIDCTRYTEFAYLFSCFGGGLKDLYILDVSSPHTLAYMLSRENKVVKTNIDAGERKFIRESARLRFSSIIGPSTNPRSIGTGLHPNILQVMPRTLKSAAR